MKYYWLVFLFFIAAYLVPLAGRPMIVPDEFRYAEIPQEMIESGDYVTPRLLGYRYFEKPVMGYWLTAGSFRVFGINAFANRLPAALGAGLGALLIALMVQQSLRDNKIAATAAAFYLSCGLVYGIGTFAVLDSQLTGFVTGILGCAFLAMLEPRFTRRKAALLACCGLFAGLAFLTKGFVAFAAPGLAVLGFIIWERRWKELWQLPWIPLAVALAVIAPWAVAVHRAEPDYWRYFVVVEHLQRFLSKEPGQHPEPFWFLVPFLVGGIFPAAFLALGAVPGMWRRRREFFRQPLYRFALCSAVLPFLFFSASSGKLPTYVLPCFPGVAVLAAGGIAAYFRTGHQNRFFQWVLTVWGALLAVAGIGVIGLMVFHPFAELASKRGAIIFLGAAGVIYGAVLLWSHRRLWRIRFYTFFTGLAAVLAIGGWAIPDELIGSKAPERALRELPQKLQYDPASVRLVTHPSLMHAVAFVHRRPDVMLLSGSGGELEYGIKEAAARGERSELLHSAQLVELLKRSDRPGVVFIERCKDDEPPRDFCLQLNGKMVEINGIRGVYFPAPATAEKGE